MQQHALLKSTCTQNEFASIFEAYYKRVFNYIRYRVNDRHSAEDLASQVFEKVMLKLEQYRESKSPFEVWLFAIARNVVNDYFRSRRKFRFFSLDIFQELVSSKKDPEGIFLRGEARDKLSKALRTLNARERNLVGLKFGAGLKNNEIARMLDMSESNAGVMLYRALKKMKHEMEREELK